MGFIDDAPRVHFETLDEWRGWLHENHAHSPGIFAVSWRSVTGRPFIPYETMVEHALCFGWIDGRVQRLDDERTMQWYTKRKPGSGWARPNKIRIERLTAEGLMMPAGVAMVEAAKADGSWTLLDSVELLEVPDDLAAAFDANPAAREFWETLPRSPRRAMLEWLVLAKTQTTRASRIEQIVERAAAGERARG